MTSIYKNITLENIDEEHICCAIGDKKHIEGVRLKKAWMKKQIENGHVFRKLDERGKVFIEYGPLETEFVPIIGNNYMYIYCFWVSGSFKEKGHGKALLQYAIMDAKEKKKDGICVVTGHKKLGFLSDKKYLEHFGFSVVDTAQPNFELLALTWNGTAPPTFKAKARQNKITEDGLVIYYNSECPYTNHCLTEIREVCVEKNIPLLIHHIDTVEKAKDMPCFMNNFCMFYNKKFITHELVNRTRLLKMLDL